MLRPRLLIWQVKRLSVRFLILLVVYLRTRSPYLFLLKGSSWRHICSSLLTLLSSIVQPAPQQLLVKHGGHMIVVVVIVVHLLDVHDECGFLLQMLGPADRPRLFLVPLWRISSKGNSLFHFKFIK